MLLEAGGAARQVGPGQRHADPGDRLRRQLRRADEEGRAVLRPGAERHERLRGVERPVVGEGGEPGQALDPAPRCRPPRARRARTATAGRTARGSPCGSRAPAPPRRAAATIAGAASSSCRAKVIPGPRLGRARRHPHDVDRERARPRSCRLRREGVLQQRLEHLLARAVEQARRHRGRAVAAELRGDAGEERLAEGAVGPRPALDQRRRDDAAVDRLHLLGRRRGAQAGVLHQSPAPAPGRSRRPARSTQPAITVDRRARAGRGRTAR